MNVHLMFQYYKNIKYLHTFKKPNILHVNLLHSYCQRKTFLNRQILNISFLFIFFFIFFLPQHDMKDKYRCRLKTLYQENIYLKQKFRGARNGGSASCPRTGRPTFGNLPLTPSGTNINDPQNATFPCQACKCALQNRSGYHILNPSYFEPFNPNLSPQHD